MLQAQQALLGVLATLTTLPIVHADQNAPRPSTAYFSMRLTSLQRLGQSEVAQGPITDKLAVLDVYSGVVMLAAYGHGAHIAMTNMLSAINLPSSRTRLAQQGVSVLDILTMNLIPVLRDATLLEERAILDFRVSLRLGNQDNAYTIETVNIHDDFGDFEGTISVNL